MDWTIEEVKRELPSVRVYDVERNLWHVGKPELNDQGRSCRVFVAETCRGYVFDWCQLRNALNNGTPLVV